MRRWWMLTCSMLVACSGTSTAPTDGGTDTGDPPPVDGATDEDAGGEDAGQDTDAGPVPDTLSLDIGPISSSPGEEDTVCIDVRLGNARDVLVTAIATHINQGSHHMIVYRSSASSERPEPRSCTPFSDILGGSAPLFIAQKEEARIDYPEGTALRLEADQMIRLEFHYINYFDGPRDLMGSVDFELAPDDGRELQEVDMIFWGTTDINIPPRSESTSEMFKTVPGPSSTHPEPIHIFGLTSHTHQTGELATIERAASAEGSGELLHESRNWAEPPLDVFEPPLTFEGEDGLRLTCNYFNGTDSTVTFGEGFYDEMCFLWAYYYPSRGFLIDF